MWFVLVTISESGLSVISGSHNLNQAHPTFTRPIAPPSDSHNLYISDYLNLYQTQATSTLTMDLGARTKELILR